uniref:Uncharacterized protein n=1 Tax=Anguilla anguilla TaxID=7936 RepID=A0A0E9R5K8_ANGAN
MCTLFFSLCNTKYKNVYKTFFLKHKFKTNVFAVVSLMF